MLWMDPVPRSIHPAFFVSCSLLEFIFVRRDVLEHFQAIPSYSLYIPRSMCPVLSSNPSTLGGMAQCEPKASRHTNPVLDVPCLLLVAPVHLQQAGCVIPYLAECTQQ